MRACNFSVALLLSASLAFAGTTPSLGTVLSSDGSIMEGTSGSYDPAGFRMEYGPDGEPLFVEECSSPLAPILPPAEQDLDGTWYPLGSGVSGCVYAIAVSGSDVYVGGQFTQAGGIPALGIARWNGSSWSALGSGVNDWVYAIAVSGSDVYVGGSFTQAGGNPANYIARWDGSSWSPLGSGVDSDVNAIAVSGSDVYVGGWLTEAGGNPTNRIARWDGSSWSVLGGGVNYPVCAIAVSGSDLYVGGEFTQAGGIPANHFARWDGSSWSALGGGVNDFVYAIVVSGSDVYAGGRFTEAGGNLANNIARWDDLNDTWFSLGSGVNDAVTAIAVSGSDVYVGGDFSEAGGSPANYIARWFDDSVGTEPPTGEVIPGGSLSLRASPNPTTAGVELSFQSTGLSPLTLEIYDAAGRLVRTQELGALPVGSQTHYWNGLDGNGSALAQGVYFLRLSSADLEASTRVVLLR